MKKLFKRMSKQNANELRQELARAHLIITLLSLIAILLLALGTSLTVSFDVTLATIAGIFLGILAIISLFVSYLLYNHTK